MSSCSRKDQVTSLSGWFDIRTKTCFLCLNALSNAHRFLMFVQIRFKSKCLVTPLALKILCRGVSLHVGPQVASVRKGFHTNRTGVRLVSRVRSFMALEKPGPGEGLATNVALMLEAVGEDVHGQGRHAYVQLVANVALLCAAGIQTTVGLLVP